MVGTVGNKPLKGHRYETGTSVPVSFSVVSSSSLIFKLQMPNIAREQSRAIARASRMRRMEASCHPLNNSPLRAGYHCFFERSALKIKSCASLLC